MKPRSFLRIIAGSILYGTLASALLSAAPASIPSLSEAEVDRLKALPHGIGNQSGLLLRDKHIESVSYLGGGMRSRHGFARRGGLLPNGLWLRLASSGPETWANGTVFFKEPFDASRYNSVVLWVRANRASARFWLELQDAGWTDIGATQGRTDILPPGGLPADQTVLIAIPFPSIYADAPIDIGSLSRLRLEFGEHTVGNDPGVAITLYGIAFVRQNPPLAAVTVVTDRPFARRFRPREKDDKPAQTVQAAAPVARKVIAPPAARPKRAASGASKSAAKASAPVERPVQRTARPPALRAGEPPREFDSVAKLGTGAKQVTVGTRSERFQTKVYFTPLSDGVTVRREPYDTAAPIGALQAGISYRALVSARVWNDRWFELQIDPRVSGWARGDELRFIDPEHPVDSDSSNGNALAAGDRPAKTVSARARSMLAGLWSALALEAPPVSAVEKEGASQRSMVDAAAPVPVSSRPSETPVGGRPTHPWLFGGLFAILSGALFAYLALKRRRAPGDAQFRAVFQEIRWPSHLEEGRERDFKAEKEFWSAEAGRPAGRRWMSVPHVALKAETNDAYRGESFLLRQLKFAREARIDLIPSLCFVRTVFQYDIFLAYPELFLHRPVPKSQVHLSDEDLRLIHVGTFPAWIPPYCQKRNGLPQRVLVSYGKMPGAPFTTDSVQYNLSSPRLRAMAIEVLKRFAKHCDAIRIEGAASLLNRSLRLHWESLPGMDDGLPEFWAEVIPAVKAAFPHVRFLCDGGGVEYDALRAVGFDLVENDRVADVMTHQIRLESIGVLRNLLSDGALGRLPESVYDLAPLLEKNGGGPEVWRSQNTLAAILLGLLPGHINLPDPVPAVFSDVLALRSRWAAFQGRAFALLETGTPACLAFARWWDRDLVLAVANFSRATQAFNLDLSPVVAGFDEKRLYLFNDVLHGTAFFNGIKSEKSETPAVAVWGQDLREKGLPLEVRGLSLTLVSVNLTRPFEQRLPTSSAAAVAHERS